MIHINLVRPVMILHPRLNRHIGEYYGKVTIPTYLEGEGIGVMKEEIERQLKSRGR